MTFLSPSFLLHLLIEMPLWGWAVLFSFTYSIIYLYQSGFMDISVILCLNPFLLLFISLLKLSQTWPLGAPSSWPVSWHAPFTLCCYSVVPQDVPAHLVLSAVLSWHQHSQPTPGSFYGRMVCRKQALGSG